MSERFQVFALPLGPLQANCFVVAGEGVGLVIDPGDEANVVIDALERAAVEPAAILVTHGHFDHVGAAAPIAAHYAIPVYVGVADAGEAAGGGLGTLTGLGGAAVDEPVLLDGERELVLGSFTVAAIPTPGHSPGAYTFSIDGHLFVGDLLFRGSVGRTDLPGGDMYQLLESIAGLVRRFPADSTVHCGHGPDTSLGRELTLNPFLSPLRNDPGRSR